MKGERSILSTALDTTKIQQKKKNCTALSFGRPTGHFMTRETVEEQKQSLSLYEFCIAINIGPLPVPGK